MVNRFQTLLSNSTCAATSWWMVPPRRPPDAGCGRLDVQGPAAPLTSLEDTVEALTGGPTEAADRLADRPARTMVGRCRLILSHTR